MRTLTIQSNALVVADRPIPAPGPRQLLVAIATSGINNADLVQVRSGYAAPPDAPPDIPGLELAGTVIETGAGADRFRVGDLVLALVGGGAHAEYAVFDERLAMPIPEGMAVVPAGCIAEALVTSHDALFTQATLSSGDRVLIHGAPGGVGTIAVQLAIAAGADVVATVRASHNRSRIAHMGATVTTPVEFMEHGPFDVVLELVSGDNMPLNIRSLASGGRIAAIGLGGTRRVELDLGLLARRRGRIHASTLRSRPLTDRATALRLAYTHALPLIQKGALDVPVHANFPFGSALEAYEAFAQPGKFGKIVMTMQS